MFIGLLFWTVVMVTEWCLPVVFCQLDKINDEFRSNWIEKIHLVWPFFVKIRAWRGIFKSNMMKTWKTSSCLCVLLLDQWKSKPNRHIDLWDKQNFCSFLCGSQLASQENIGYSGTSEDLLSKLVLKRSLIRAGWYDSPAVTCPHHILSCCCAPLRRAWLCLLPILQLGSCNLLSKLLKPNSVLTHHVLQPPDLCGGPPWCHSTVSGVSLVWGAPDWTWVSKCHLKCSLVCSCCWGLTD